MSTFRHSQASAIGLHMFCQSLYCSLEPLRLPILFFQSKKADVSVASFLHKDLLCLSKRSQRWWWFLHFWPPQVVAKSGHPCGGVGGQQWCWGRVGKISGSTDILGRLTSTWYHGMHTPYNTLNNVWAQMFGQRWTPWDLWSRGHVRKVPEDSGSREKLFVVHLWKKWTTALNAAHWPEGCIPNIPFSGSNILESLSSGGGREMGVEMWMI